MPKEKQKPVPDEVVSWGEHFWKYLESHWKEILTLLVAAVIIVLVVWLVKEYRESGELKAEREYFEIMKNPDDDAKAVALEGFGNKHSGSSAALLADMWLGNYYDKKGEFQKSADFYGKAIAESKSGPLHVVAVDALVPVYINMGRFSEAADLYLKLADEGVYSDPYLSKYKAASVIALGGDAERAKDIYKGLAGDEKTPAAVKLKAEEQLIWIETLNR